MRCLRIALCQIECHPALFVSHLDYLSEPFILPPRSTLSLLAAQGLDVAAIKQLCRDEYLKWHATRVDAVLAFLETLDPTPDLVVFPEGAIPLDILPDIAAFSGRTGAAVLAGTHTPRHRPAAKQLYGTLGVAEASLLNLARKGCINVLAFFSAGRLELVPKVLASPFERTMVTPSEDVLPALRPRALPGSNVSVLPMVCSEALRTHQVTAGYDVSCVLSYDERPEQFAPVLTNEVRNRRVAVYCNDGRFGGSRICCAFDDRTVNWYRDVMGSGLPPSEALLVADVDLDATAVEVGTASPTQNFRLIALASVIYEQSRLGSLVDRLAAASQLADAAARCRALETVASALPLSDILATKIQFLRQLEEEGVPSGAYWAVLGRDCLVARRGDLRELEARLAASCSRLLNRPETLRKATAASDLGPVFLRYLQECNARATNAGALDLPQDVDTRVAVINRETETREILAFFDDPAQVLLELSGLQQIGKSAVLSKALAQSGVAPSLSIQVTDTASPEFILSSVLRRPTEVADPEDHAVTLDVETALKGIRVLILENAHLLMAHGVWRRPEFPELVRTLAYSCEKSGCKLVIATRRELPVELRDPSMRRRMRVRGLDRHLAAYGMAVFDAQLRRVGLSPAAVSMRDKQTIVAKLGGHPVAIALAADVSYEQGLRTLLNSLKTRTGFFLNYVSALIRQLGLSRDDITLLSLLSLARSTVPREVLLAASGADTSDSIRSLISLGAIEVAENGGIEIAGILREYFEGRTLSDERKRAFHEEAARAFSQLYANDEENLAAAVEAEYHARVVGRQLTFKTPFVDGALASARRLFDEQKYEDASRILEPLLEKRRTIDVVRLGALVEVRLRRFDRAIALAGEAFRQDPRDTWLIAQLAKICLTQYQEDRASELVRIARNAGVEDVSLLLVEGRLHLRNHEFRLAEAAFQRAREIAYRTAWPYFYLGSLYIRTGRLDDAVSVLHDGERFIYEQQVKGRNVQNAIKTKLGVAYLLMGRVDLAAPFIESAYADDPDNPEGNRAYAALTVAKEGIREAHVAIERLNQAAARGRDQRSQLHLLIGDFHLRTGDRFNAAGSFRRAVAADAGNVFAMMRLARVLFDLGEASSGRGEGAYRGYLDECARTVHRILDYDVDNAEGKALMNLLMQRYGIAV